MPTSANDDIARRLQEISTLLSLIKVMTGEPSRTSATHHLWMAVEDLCDVPDDDHHHKSRLVRALFLLVKKLRGLNDPDTWDDDIGTLFEVIGMLTKPPSESLALQMPTYTNMKGEAIMANFALALDKIATFTITEFNTVTNTFDPVAPTDTFTAVSSDPTNLNAVIGTDASGAPALVVNWLHTVDPLLTGVSVTINDSMGNTADVQLFDMVQPAAVPDQIGLDVSGVTMANQPVPV